jgi:hypothetical protein
MEQKQFTVKPSSCIWLQVMVAAFGNRAVTERRTAETKEQL